MNNEADISTPPDFEEVEEITTDKRGRCWVFTLNGLGVSWSDWSIDTIHPFIESLSNLAHVRYICGGVESGEKTNRLHFQGYIEFTKSVRYTSLGCMLDSRFKLLKYKPKSDPKYRDNLPRGYSYAPKNSHHSLTWIHPKKGNREQARDYSLKQGNYEEENHTQVLSPVQYGKWVENGTRLDLEDLAQDIVLGKKDHQIFERDPVTYMRHIKMIRETRTMLHEHENLTKFRHMEVCYISGNSRSGKTTLITDHFGYENIYRITDSKNPWDGYYGQPIIIFEEFRQTFPLELMLSWLEGHPVSLPARYFNRPAGFTKVFIISNWPWSMQYEEDRSSKPEDYQALLNRIHHVLRLVRTGDHTQVFKDSQTSLNSLFEFNSQFPKLLIENELID